MNTYTITILYAAHGDGAKAPETFPAQTIPAGEIQLLPAAEPDLYHPRRNSLSLLSEARGEYTIFLDEGDAFRENFLKQLLTRAAESPAFVMPSMEFKYAGKPAHYFSLPDEDSGPVQYYYADGQAPLFPMELHGVLFSTEALKKAAAECAGEPEPEKQILLALLRQWPEFVFLPRCSLLYAYPRDCDFEYCVLGYAKDWYCRPLKEFLLPQLQEGTDTPDPVQAFILPYMALYMLRIRFLSNQGTRSRNILTAKDLPAFLSLCRDVLSRLEVTAILNYSFLPARVSSPFRLMELRLRAGNWSLFPRLCPNNGTAVLSFEGQKLTTLSSLMLRVSLIDCENGRFELDAAYFDEFPDEATVAARMDGEGTYYYPVYNHRYSLTKFFGQSFFRQKTFHISVPLGREEQILNFYLCYEGREYRMACDFPSHTSRFSRRLPGACQRFGDWLTFWDKGGIHILPYDRKTALTMELQFWQRMWKEGGVIRRQLPLKMLNFFLQPYFSRRHIWLFQDKIYKGGDSSEYLYRYAARQKDGVRKYYLLDQSSADYKRMRSEGYRPLARGSLKHRLVFLNADMVIASNSTVFAFNDMNGPQELPFRGCTHFGVACVQHGMSVQKIAAAQNRLRDNTKLYFCASKYEIQNLSHPVYDYNGYDALKLTGVPRYDGLKSRAQKILLFSPTWRMNSALPAPNGESYSRDYNPNFKETAYYKVYNGLMNDPRLLEAARKYGYRIQYVLHPIVSPQAEDFTGNDLVEIIPSVGEMSYEKLFCEAALMVTDFSGVQFDFAYMRKPVVYLHHNEIPQHYEEGSFFYETMGFGEICHTNEELIAVLCRYMADGCVMPEEYQKRADDFFAFSDHENCARIYPVLLDYQKKHFGASRIRAAAQRQAGEK